ncbi:hypothetical protein Desaci_1514 [Desulfosporosinus acidiphilus SJ4]|uniref:Uncharacterized protein n=1 Tax=Desulfosporosinus acidiphilus (strain DSM 22704 / JCM 16185 / SJ4) TaxID=646529 RepID=I4D403_DESAJ|nr:hypothetical protein Desaci_1514 [Desulfosporosinus acidiphilus SJ4]
MICSLDHGVGDSVLVFHFGVHSGGAFGGRNSLNWIFLWLTNKTISKATSQVPENLVCLYSGIRRLNDYYKELK